MQMYKLISTIVHALISPENWIIVLLGWLLLSKAPVVRKRLTTTIVLLIFVLGNEYIYTSLVNAWQPKPVTLPLDAVYDAGIVLGGSASFDKFGRGYFNAASDRFIETCILYKTKKIKKIIISGGSNGINQPKDADFQFKKMIEIGVPSNDIIVENASVNTFENATFSKAKLDSLHLKPPFVLITSAMHIPRAQKVFIKAGIPVIPFPCNYYVVENNLSLADYLIPKAGVLLSWNGYLREVVGIAGYKLTGKL